MIYFTADIHFGHKAIITMQNRPFGSVEEMDRVLLQNYNSVVRNEDTVYILGDICHHMSIEGADAIIKKLNGKKYLIKGNHDKNYDPRLFVDIGTRKISDVKYSDVKAFYYKLIIDEGLKGTTGKIIF